MLSTPHLLVGAAIARSIPNPAISLPAAFVSHFLLDMTPHWDGSPSAPYKKKVIGGAALDYALGATIIFLISRGYPNQPIILLGAFLATLPDFISILFRHVSRLGKIGILKKYHKYHLKIQVNVRFSIGVITSIATSLVALAFLAR
ncbi:MAG: hypothetical protein A2172_02000 [Candidatus Woykebacteria bacterium RBG_13_40_15]|uniref:Uncharacterized protein n=1 Tax=Candidatus Woykebacteria bacterium RBG_13_40_15 TaxID=1802593 RepID=A0A1G1W604_9BACT|nr:MAG: hypothetical protein A2172_02000 [Candidatus Woykebacteria bacterium RBG_13_40_15]